MSENEKILTPVRVAFTKTGCLSFISHLDLMRTVTRLLVRADIGVYYTEGFNPHPKLVFALPLSVGTESISELFDIKVWTPAGGAADLSLIAERLRREAPSGMEIKDVYTPERKFRDIAYAEYDIVIRHAGIPENAEEVVRRMTESPIIEVKRTKSGERECDLRPFIAELSCEHKRASGALHVRTRLSADPEQYLNPEYVVKAVKKALGMSEDDIAPGGDFYTVTRTAILDREGREFR